MHGLRTTAFKPLIGSEAWADVDALVGGALAEDLRHLLFARGVVVLRGLHIDDGQQRRITEGLGRLRLDAAGEGLQKVTVDTAESPDYAAYFPMTYFWHYDGHYAETVPCLGASMRPVRLAGTGGETEFLNAYAAYEGLDEADRRLIDGLRVVHTRTAANYFARPEASDTEAAAWRRFAPASQPLVWQHASGRKSLLLRSSVSHVEGMHPADSYDLLCRLRAHMGRAEYVYTHDWRMGDLLLWDNTGTLHRARPFDAASGRLLHRFTLDGEEPIRGPGSP